ncbi:cation diffusion facilitator family transporter [Dehalogenimonas formicexedens]|uniref:Cation diffusion facilitator family transporter n=1 Tax=Dehalogenimonas formicexedens TaxID=1839801 RepID=A0A1P8FAE0_9CHLR|nr:cation diffusion facilitator family transporter [Dehalogenimonas formicexedens]APV45398.1 cation diffusion facilitator family transporter [Dehalogenimonas formicexedens]
MSGASRVAAISVGSNSLLIALKLVVGLVTGSVSILAEAIHSSIDLLAAVIAFFGLRAAGKPADREHPFGHGKWENVSGSVEAVLIFVAAIWIIYEAVKKIMHGVEVELLGWGIAVMAVSVIVNTLVSRNLFKQAKIHDSIALEADGQHLRTDVITSLGVLVGLALVQFTGLKILDPIIAIGVALIIVKAAWDILRKSFGGIIDTGLPPEEEKIIIDTLAEHKSQLVDFHEIRTRKSGAERFADLHLVMPGTLSVDEAHKMCDHLEADLKRRLPRLEITLHVEPCDDSCKSCEMSCDSRRSG